MKYQVLLAGKNNAIMDEFFDYMKLAFNTLTSSMRMEDLAGHIELMHPDIFVYCLYNETKYDYSHIMELKGKLRENDITFAIIGAKEECDDFLKTMYIQPDIVLTKPLSANIIQNKIAEFLDDKEEYRRMLEEEKLQEERRAAEESERLQEKMDDKDSRKHVLIIDDDPMMLKVIKEHLIEKYDVSTAVSGKVAYKFLEHKHTDLILLDYAMPTESGPEVLEKLRTNEATKDIPIVFLTGITEKDKIQKALILKPQGYLLKPIDRERLLATIESLIG